MSQISIETLRALLDYNPETGDLTWNPRPASMFKTARAAAMWNTRYAMNPAFTTGSNGYLTGGIFGRKYKAHRVAWALHYGEWPADQIDHKNGTRSDNRLGNLRCVTNSENQRNAKRRATNTSGIMGVAWHKREGKWQARIMVDRRYMHLGYFTDFSAAVSARKAAETDLGYHENHGRPA